MAGPLGGADLLGGPFGGGGGGGGPRPLMDLTFFREEGLLPGLIGAVFVGGVGGFVSSF